MLLELLVENYAVVERVRVNFHRGLNLLTGETGSGKSILVDALGLLFGERASGEGIRAEAPRARLSAIFEVPGDPGFQELLERAGVEIDNCELLIEREILTGDKSRAFAGSRPVTAAFLRELAPYLGDIHGQHEQQQLFSPEAQLAAVDEFAGNEAQVRKVRVLYSEWAALEREFEDLARSEADRLRLADLWTFQQKEIEAVAPKPGEDAQLESDKLVLKNLARLQESASGAYAALYDAPGSAAAQIRTAVKRLEEICRIDESMAPAVEALRAADVAVQEAAESARDYLDRLEGDPARIDDVEARLAALDRLKRKYGTTVEEILQFLETVRNQLNAVENSNERRAELAGKRDVAAAAYRTEAATLTEIRRAASGKLAAAVKRELTALAMGSTTFSVDLREAKWSSSGSDRVQFLISANPGEEPRPLDRVASGGELSRLALALKTAAKGNVKNKTAFARTLVFDEVDSGIGGGVAEMVGRRLKKLAATDQVLCVTHLAQIAGFADHHYVVEKRVVGGRTTAEVEELTAEARTQEIGRMLSGQLVTEEALKHAAQLLRLAGE